MRPAWARRAKYIHLRRLTCSSAKASACCSMKPFSVRCLTNLWVSKLMASLGVHKYVKREFCGEDLPKSTILSSYRACVSGAGAEGRRFLFSFFWKNGVDKTDCFFRMG